VAHRCNNQYLYPGDKPKGPFSFSFDPLSFLDVARSDIPSFISISMVEATIENTVGAAFLGCVAASMYVLYPAFLFGMVSYSRSRLFGVTLLQVYLYYIHYSKDWVFQKIAVSLLLLSLLHVLTKERIRLESLRTSQRCWTKHCT